MIPGHCRAHVASPNSTSLHVVVLQVSSQHCTAERRQALFWPAALASVPACARTVNNVSSQIDELFWRRQCGGGVGSDEKRPHSPTIGSQLPAFCYGWESSTAAAAAAAAATQLSQLLLAPPLPPTPALGRPAPPPYFGADNVERSRQPAAYLGSTAVSSGGLLCFTREICSPTIKGPYLHMFIHVKFTYCKFCSEND
jgi:hypothetical protein